MNMENLQPSGDKTGKFEAMTGVNIDDIMNEVNKDFESGKLIQGQQNFEEPADMDDHTTKRLDARSKNN